MHWQGDKGLGKQRSNYKLSSQNEFTMLNLQTEKYMERNQAQQVRNNFHLLTTKNYDTALAVDYL